RRLSPGTIRVLLTAYPGNTTVRHGLSRDVQWLISKPWNDAALRLTLRQLLQDREIHPPGPRVVLENPQPGVERGRPGSRVDARVPRIDRCERGASAVTGSG